MNPVLGVVLVIGGLLLGYLALEWLMAGRQKRRLAQGYGVPNGGKSIDHAAAENRRDAEFNYGHGPYSSGFPGDPGIGSL